MHTHTHTHTTHNHTPWTHTRSSGQPFICILMLVIMVVLGKPNIFWGGTCVKVLRTTDLGNSGCGFPSISVGKEPHPYTWWRGSNGCRSLTRSELGKRLHGSFRQQTHHFDAQDMEECCYAEPMWTTTKSRGSLSELKNITSFYYPRTQSDTQGMACQDSAHVVRGWIVWVAGHLVGAWGSW